MLRQHSILCACLFGAILVVSPNSSSADARPPEPRFGLGVFSSYSSSPYKDHGDDINVLPAVSYRGERFFLRGPLAGYSLYKDTTWGLNMIAQYKFDVDAFEESAALSGMDKRDGTLLAGVDANIKFLDHWRLDTVLKSDVLGTHDGQQATLLLSRSQRFKKTAITPGIGLNWHSSNENAFYYGVGENESAPGRPAYNPGSSINWFLNLALLHRFSDSISLIGTTKLEFLSDDIQDSPIVEEDVVIDGFLSLNYSF